MFLSEWREFPSAALPWRKNAVRVSMLLKSRASLTCFRAVSFLVSLRTYQHPGKLWDRRPTAWSCISSRGNRFFFSEASKIYYGAQSTMYSIGYRWYKERQHERDHSLSQSRAEESVELYLHFPIRPTTWCLIKQTRVSEFLSLQQLRQNAGIFGLIYLKEHR